MSVPNIIDFRFKPSMLLGESKSDPKDFRDVFESITGLRVTLFTFLFSLSRFSTGGSIPLGSYKENKTQNLLVGLISLVKLVTSLIDWL